MQKTLSLAVAAFAAVAAHARDLYANHAAHTDALRFIESNLRQCRAMGLGWCAWGFSGSRFGILNSFRADVAYEDWHGEKLDRAMLELLRHKAWEEER